MCVCVCMHMTLKDLKPFHEWEGAKKLTPTSFPPLTSSNVEIIPRKVLTFSFNPLPHSCKILRPYLMEVPNF